MRLSLVGYGSNALLPQTSPIAEPLTLTAVKQQVRRVTVDDDDEYLQDVLIPAVRERAEQATRRQCISAIWDLRLDSWDSDAWSDGGIRIPLPPLQSVVSVSYVDTGGTTQVWSSTLYTVDAPSGPRAQRGRIVPVYAQSWPTARDVVSAVTIRFIAGYGDTADTVPPRLKMAMLEDLGTLYEHREDIIVGQGYSIAPFPMGSEAIYRAFKSY